MSGVIYLMRDKGGLVVMREQAYDTESLPTLNNESALEQFREALDWFVRETRTS